VEQGFSHVWSRALALLEGARAKQRRTEVVAAVTIARRLSASKDATARWVETDALAELTSPRVVKRIKLEHTADSNELKRFRIQPPLNRA